MADQESLDTVALLLMKYPGVSSAAGFAVDVTTVSIHFRCSNFESLKAIGSCAVAANVPVSLWNPDSSLCYEEPGVEDCPFSVVVEDECLEDGPPSASQIFGVFLARDLKVRGIIEPEFSELLQSKWNSVPL